MSSIPNTLSQLFLFIFLEATWSKVILKLQNNSVNGCITQPCREKARRSSVGCGVAQSSEGYGVIQIGCGVAQLVCAKAKKDAA